MAVDDDLIRKNPFGFELASVVVNDSVTREAISRKQERDLLKFIKEDKHFNRYYRWDLYPLSYRASYLGILWAYDPGY